MEIASAAGFTEGGIVRNAKGALVSAKKKLKLVPKAGENSVGRAKASPKRKLGQYDGDVASLTANLLSQIHQAERTTRMAARPRKQRRVVAKVLARSRKKSFTKSR